MRLKNIKTEKEFWKIAENRYQRTHTLRRIWQNTKETQKYREKAFRLWRIMLFRTMKLMPIITKIKTNYRTNFNKGG